MATATPRTATRRLRRGALAVTVVAAAATAGIVRQQSRTPARPCATVAAGYEHRFATAPGGWGGGDGVFSVALPGGRAVWTFGDSFVGSHMQPNSALLQDAHGHLRLVAAPVLRLPAGHDGWLWPGAGWVVGRDLWTLWNQTISTGTGPLAFRFERTWLARSDARTLRLRSLRPAPDRSGIAWGTAALRHGPDIYLFGVEHHSADKHAHLARLDAAHPWRPWRFRNRRGWERAPEHAWHVANDVASTFTVVPAPGGFAMVSMHPLGRRELRVQTAPQLTGPWTPPRVIYRLPVAANILAYNALAHPEATGDGLLVSYSLSSGWEGLPSRTLALPRFVRVRRTCLRPR